MKLSLLLALLFLFVLSGISCRTKECTDKVYLYPIGISSNMTANGEKVTLNTTGAIELESSEVAFINTLLKKYKPDNTIQMKLGNTIDGVALLGGKKYNLILVPGILYTPTVDGEYVGNYYFIKGDDSVLLKALYEKYNPRLNPPKGTVD